tara:strand:- start:23 stop:811 length:789 start_codon:yes stop_codon:yes gene_type:complete
MLLESVVIGSTIESANFALTNGHFFINVREYMQPFYGNLDKWSRAILELGFSGKLLSYDECPKIRIQDNSLRVISDSRLYKYSFEVCYILDPTRVTHENKIIETNEKTFLVLDDFELSQLGKNNKTIKNLNKDSDFPRKIIFYTSDRVDGANYITDCVVESVLKHEDLNNFDYSDTMVKFVVERYLKSQNINGAFMNLYKNGTPKYRKPLVKHVRRLIVERDNNKYKDSEKVKFKVQDTNEFKPKGTPLSRYYTALGQTEHI